MIAFAFDAGMTRYAIRLRDGTILVRRMGDDQEIARFAAQGDREIWVFAFSPDGKYLATNDYPSRAVVVWDLDGGTLCVRDPGPVSGMAARFSPDSRRIAVAHDDGSLLVYDLKTGQCCRRWSGPAPASDLAFRPDSGQIAVVYRESQPTCRILDADTAKQVRTISLPGTDPSRGAPTARPWRSEATTRKSLSGTPQQATAGRPWRGLPTAACEPPFTRPERCWPATALKDGSGSGTRSWAVRS